MDVAKIRRKIKGTSGQKPPENVQEEAPADVQKPEGGETAAMQKSAETPTEAVQPEVSAAAGLPVPGTDDKSESEPEDEQMEVLAFNIANEEYAVMTREIQEILRYQDITAVPRAERYFKGVTSIRGKILPVIDLKEKLGLKEESSDKRKIIILRTLKEPIGILVGLVLDVLRFPASSLLLPPSTLNDEEKNFVRGVIRVKDRFISVLNVEEIAKIS